MTYKLISIVPISRKINAIYADFDGSFYRTAIVGIQTYVEVDNFGEEGDLQWGYLEENISPDEPGDVGPSLGIDGFLAYEVEGDLDEDKETRERRWKRAAEKYASDWKEKEEARKRKRQLGEGAP